MADLALEEIEQDLADHFQIYSSNLLKVQDEEGHLLPFAWREVQTILDEILTDIHKQGRPIRAYILKARREGVSTYINARYYWKTATNFNRYAVIVTHEPEATDTLFGMVKRFHVHNEWKPQDRYNNKKMLEFNDEKGQGLDSAIKVGTAGKENFGSGQMIHYLHLSEVPKWPTHTQTALLTSLFQCVPDDSESEVILEGTAQGIGGVFYDGYWACRYVYEVFLGQDGKPQWKCKVNSSANPSNVYSSIFIPWFVFSRYQMDVPQGFIRDGEEEGLVRQYGITDRQLAWRRWAIENKSQGSKEIFKQEYPSNPREAFLSSGRPVFDISKVLAYKDIAPKPIARYTCQMSTGQFIADKEGNFLVWEEPITGRPYVISADIAEGLEKGDFDSVDVVDQLKGKQVAHYHGKMPPDQLGIFLIHVGRRYNTAWLVPERNNHGLTTVTKVQDMRYPRLYAERIIEPPHKPRNRFGWLTSKKSKFEIIDNLAGEIRDNTHLIQNADTFNEMLSFKHKEDGSMEAEEGMFDDQVMSIAIAKYVRTRLPMTTFQSVYEATSVAEIQTMAGWI